MDRILPLALEFRAAAHPQAALLLERRDRTVAVRPEEPLPHFCAAAEEQPVRERLPHRDRLHRDGHLVAGEIFVRACGCECALAICAQRIIGRNQVTDHRLRKMKPCVHGAREPLESGAAVLRERAGDIVQRGIPVQVRQSHEALIRGHPPCEALPDFLAHLRGLRGHGVLHTAAVLLAQRLEKRVPVGLQELICRGDACVQRENFRTERILLFAQSGDFLIRHDGLHLSAQRLPLAQAVADEFARVVAAVQIFDQVVLERIECRQRLPFFRRLREDGGRRAHQIHRVNPHAPRVVRRAQRPGHRERAERLQHALGMFALGARAQAAVGREVAFSGVHIHHDEDAAEDPEQLVELREDLIEKKVVRLHHEDRARRAVAELAREHVVAEIHPAVEPRRVHEDHRGFVERWHGHLDVHAPDRLGKIHRGIECDAGLLRRADLRGEHGMRVLHDGLQLHAAAEHGLAPVVARDGVVRRLRVLHEDEARIAGERRDFAHVSAAQCIHQRALAALQRAENQQVGVLAFELVGE